MQVSATAVRAEEGTVLFAGEETREWHDSKVALLSAAVFAPAALAMLFNAHLSKKGQERHWHGCVPVFAAGICLGCEPSVHCCFTAVQASS